MCIIYSFIMSQSLLWKRIVLLAVGVDFKQPQSVLYHRNQYDEEVSKKCRSVRLSVCNANKKNPTPPSLLTVEK